MNLRCFFGLVGAIALAGCGTTYGVQPPVTQGNQTAQANLLVLATSEPTTPEAAREVGVIFFSHYADRNRDARRTRNIINLVIWAASTYTAGAAGLGAHADNIFVGSLVGTSASTLDTVLVPGGPQTSQGGMARTACVIRAVDRANRPEILGLVASLRTAPEQTEGARAAIAQYENLFPRSISAYLTIYEAYLAGSSPRLLSASAVGDAIAATRPKAADAGESADPAASAAGQTLTVAGQATAASALTARSDEISAAMAAC
jgi:hypothetical protein